MLPDQIVIDNGANEKQEQAIKGGDVETNRNVQKLSHSNHGTKNRAVGNILAVEPTGDDQKPEDQAMSAMMRQSTGRPEGGGDDDEASTGSGHSSTIGAARMNSVHRRKLRQQQEKGALVANQKSAAASAYSAAASGPGPAPGESPGSGGRVGNWREMYAVEVSSEGDALDASGKVVKPSVEVVESPMAATTPQTSISSNVGTSPHPVSRDQPGYGTVAPKMEAGADFSAGGVPTQIVQEVHVPPPMPPHQYQQHPPYYAPHPNMPPYGQDPHGVPHLVHGHGPVPRQSHDERYEHAHQRAHPHSHPETYQDASYRNVYAAPESKPNFAGHNVKFGDLEIRVYERILGDNPSCSSGPPIGIGWNFYSFTAPSSAPSGAGSSFRGLSDDEESHDGGRSTRTELVVSLEKYERTRGPRCEAHDLVLARQTREELLVEAGYTRGQMADAVRQSLKVKHQRRQTVTNFKLEDIEEVLEKASRSFKRVFLSGDKRRKSRTNYMYLDWLEQSRHNGITSGQSQRGLGRQSQSILIQSDEDKARRNSVRRSTGQIAFNEPEEAQ